MYLISVFVALSRTLSNKDIACCTILLVALLPNVYDKFNPPGRVFGLINTGPLCILLISSLIVLNSKGFFSIVWWTVNAFENGLTTSWLNLLNPYSISIASISEPLCFLDNLSISNSIPDSILSASLFQVFLLYVSTLLKSLVK